MKLGIRHPRKEERKIYRAFTTPFVRWLSELGFHHLRKKERRKKGTGECPAGLQSSHYLFSTPCATSKHESYNMPVPCTTSLPMVSPQTLLPSHLDYYTAQFGILKALIMISFHMSHCIQDFKWLVIYKLSFIYSRLKKWFWQAVPVTMKLQPVAVRHLGSRDYQKMGVGTESNFIWIVNTENSPSLSKYWFTKQTPLMYDVE